MFQTVPDTSSYVKVRHDSIFKQVMSKVTILQKFAIVCIDWSLIPIPTELSWEEKEPSVGEGLLLQFWFWE